MSKVPELICALWKIPAFIFTCLSPRFPLSALICSIRPRTGRVPAPGNNSVGKVSALVQSNKAQQARPITVILSLAKPQASLDLSSSPGQDYTTGFSLFSCLFIFFFPFQLEKYHFLSVQIEGVIFLSVFKLASLGTCSEVVMSTLQNRANSHLAKK